VARINVECRRAGIGCVECKQIFAASLNEHLVPFRARRQDLAARPGHVEAVLADGAERARRIAVETMGEVRQAVGLP
jgi:tryptophanyl-tRNA synthetase